ncbi:MAG: branched-chain amino acid aminotransferase [Bryobacteraceae bacterium]
MRDLSITIESVAMSRRTSLDLRELPFSAVISDHMLVAEYGNGAWQSAAIRPYGPLALAPSISALHYGISVFEGLKAYRMPDGSVAMFRPRCNARRFQRSAERLAMPPVPEELFMNGLRELLRLDQPWVPAHDEGALYIRPCQFSIDESVRVKPGDRYLFVAFTFPYGTYYAVPVDVIVTERYVRAFSGGVGDVKPAGNYAPTLVAEREAQREGFQTVMWLDGLERRYVEECGVMNVFFVVGDQVITPRLEGTILAGVTRDSIMRLLGDTGHSVEERRISMDEIVGAHERGALRECFGTGTAATLSHVRRIRFGERDLELPPVEARAVGPEVRRRLISITTGRERDPYGWLDAI